MRILHIADSHLGYAAYNALTPEGLNQREEDVQRAFSWAVDTAIAERVGAVVHSGDLFDSIRPSNRVVRFAMDELRRLSDAGVDFLVVSGNHDAPRMRTTGSVLRLLEHIPRIHAFYSARAGRVVVGDVAFACLGHIPDAEQYGRELAACVPDADARRNVLVLHVGVGGVAVFKTAEFNEVVVPLGSLPEGFDYTALGHYHRETEVAYGAWYAGSLERHSFSEADDAKCARLVDLDDGSARSVPYRPRPMVRLSVDAQGLNSSETERRCAELAEGVPDGAVVSLSVSNLDPSARRMLDAKGVRARFGKALHVSMRLSASDGVPGPGAGLAGGGLSDEFSKYAKAVGAGADATAEAARHLEASE